MDTTTAIMIALLLALFAAVVTVAVRSVRSGWYDPQGRPQRASAAGRTTGVTGGSVTRTARGRPAPG